MEDHRTHNIKTSSFQTWTCGAIYQFDTIRCAVAVWDVRKRLWIMSTKYRAPHHIEKKTWDRPFVLYKTLSSFKLSNFRLSNITQTVKACNGKHRIPLKIKIIYLSLRDQILQASAFNFYLCCEESNVFEPVLRMKEKKFKGRGPVSQLLFLDWFIQYFV